MMEDPSPKFPPETSIDEIGLSVRARNALYKMGIRTARELSRLTDQQLLGCHGFGRGSLDEVVKLLGKDFDRQELYAPGEADVWLPIKQVVHRTGYSQGHIARVCQRLAAEGKARKQRGPKGKPSWCIRADAAGEFRDKSESPESIAFPLAPAAIAADGLGVTFSFTAPPGSQISMTQLPDRTNIQIIQPKNGAY